MENQAKMVLQELENMLENIYANLEVPREKVGSLVDRGRALTQAGEAWPGGEPGIEEFLKKLDSLERKIHQTIDLQKLKEAGLVKAVKL